MTHFASAADFTSTQTDEQVARFDACYAALREAGHCDRLCAHVEHQRHRLRAHRSVAQHGARRARPLRLRFARARCGAHKPILDVQPALSWKAKILAVKDIPEGALVGYGGTFRAPHAMRIAILAAGYADGVFHRLSNRGKVIAAGQLTPILGTVSMDLTTIDVSHAMDLRPGDAVTLLGTEGDVTLDAQQIARVAGTISYNILSSISARVRRVYV